jgi:hypothetical protein
LQVASGTFLPATCNLPLAAVSSGEKLKTLTEFDNSEARNSYPFKEPV